MEERIENKETIIERIIGWCAQNTLLVMIGVLFLLIAGILSVKNVNLDAIPDLSDVQVIVFTEWPGRDPQIVEDQITYPIVSKLVPAPRVKYVRGQTFFGLSFVNVIFEDGTDMYWARSRVLEYLNQVAGDLPSGITPTIGPDATGVGWVYEYALVDKTGKHSLTELRSFQDWVLRYYLQSTPGVAEVASVGGFVKQYQVDIDPNKLLAYKIPLTKVIQAIRESNNDVGGRVIEYGETEYMVRGEGYIKSVADIEKVVIGIDTNGVPVTVKDVGYVHLGPDMRRGLLELDGKGEAVGGIIVMRYGENALTTIEAVKKKLEEIKPSLPPGVEIVTGYDRSDLILGAITNLKEKLLEESVIVSLICIIFLFHFRSALVAIITLPIAIALAFIPMTALGVSSNIMSLSGIAIAIGAMVDAAIVMIENAHKWLERWNHAREKREKEGEAALSVVEREIVDLNRRDVIIRAAKQVGRPLFFSLLVITVSFLPVFALQAQSGRLFKPLAFTKTFSMFFASLLSVTLVPLLMVWLIRGHIANEQKNPINRFLIWAYRPLVQLVLKFKWLTILAAAVVLILTWIPYQRIGSEFMPPLNEGTLLFMPTAVPGMAISAARTNLQLQDQAIAKFPEVEHVYGKIGRARSATDPASLSMVETVITLKPEKEWREGMTFEKIREELSKQLQVPGMPAIWWMPIQTRIEMLSTGIRSEIGIKVLGPDLKTIQHIAEQIEAVLKKDPNSATVFAERVTGGYYVNFKVNREAISRYGLTVGDVETIIESAIGGKNITTTVEGRERYPVNVRYARELRNDIPSLRRVLVATPTGAQVPMAQLADIYLETGPPSIRDENGMLAGFVFVDTKGIDLGSYVTRAKKLITENVKMPPGYYLDWGGQYQYLVKARETLQLIIPLTLVIVFVILYLNFRNVVETFIVLLSVPFALVGGIWLMWLLGYNFSVAVAIGFIALAGVAAEIGVVMIIYLDEAWKHLLKEKTKPTTADLTTAVIEGASQRVRPVMMTVCAIIFSLLPILWGHGTGSDTMKRIAAPMVGGMISATVLSLLIVPVIYYFWRSREIENNSPTISITKTRKIRWSLIAGFIAALSILVGCLAFCVMIGKSGPMTTIVLSQSIGSYQMKVFSTNSQLKVGENPLRIEVIDPSTGHGINVKTVWLKLHLDMAGMQMQTAAQLEKTDNPGEFIGFIKISESGNWHASSGYENGQGKKQTTFNLNVQR